MGKLGVVELFAGIAGLAQGFAETGPFEIRGLLDIDPLTRESFLLNYPNTTYIEGTIRSIDPKAFLERIGGERPFAVLGCPPCQGLSAAGKRKLSDVRNKLIYNFFRYIKYLKPQVFVLENVPQVLEFSNYTGLIKEFAEAEKYNTWSGVMNCALYGLPQTRQRAVVVGYRSSLGILPKIPVPTHYGEKEIYSYSRMKMLSTKDSSTYEEGLGWYACVSRERKKQTKEELERLLSLPPLVTVEDALGDLPKADSAGSPIKYDSLPVTAYQETMRSGCVALSSHLKWGHSSEMQKRIGNIEEGSVQHKETDRGRSKKYFSQAYGRLHRMGIARTITGNFHNPGCGRFIHYAEDRTLTVREAMRLQGFEDKFLLAGKPSDQRRMVGNAFPKVLARVIASQIKKDFIL